MTFVPGRKMLVCKLQPSQMLTDACDLLNGRLWQQQPYEAIALWSPHSNGWYVFDPDEFDEKALTFLSLDVQDQHWPAFQDIFHVFESKQVPRVEPLGDPFAAGELMKQIVVESPLTFIDGLSEEVMGAWLPRVAGRQTVARMEHRGGGVIPVGETILLDGSRSPASTPSPRTDLEKSGPPSSETVTRTPHIGFDPAPPVLGRMFRVEVFADQEAFAQGESGSDLKIDLPAGVTSVTLDVSLHVSKTLRVTDVAVKHITLKRDEARSTSAFFDVEWTKSDADPKKENVMAVFACENRHCGWVVRNIADAPSSGLMPLRAGALSIPNDSVKAPDLLVTVVCPSRDEQHFSVSVESPLLADYKTKRVKDWPLHARAREMMNAFVANFSSPDLDNATRLRRMCGVGKKLFDLAPAEFKTALEQLEAQEQRPLSILVVSEEGSIPWELMARLPEAGQAADAWRVLGAMHNVGRWTNPGGLPPVQRLHIDGAWVISPDYSEAPSNVSFLNDQATEANFVVTKAAGEKLDPASASTLDSKIGSAPKPLIHFIGHGKMADSDFDQSLLFDAGEQVSTIDIEGSASLARALNGMNPLVFLNACHAGQPLRSLAGGVGGFAPSFLGMGASAVIAPLWTVRDSIAHKIASSLYEELSLGGTSRPLAAIFRECRQKAFDPASATLGEDTYAAYCFYGDPNMIIEWDVPAPQQTNVLPALP